MGAPEPGAAARSWRTWVEAAVVAAAVFYVSCLVEAPGRAGFSFGATYQRMAEDPFAFRYEFPHRPLLPLLAHVLGLTGTRFWIASQGTSVLLLVVAHVAARQFGARFVDAVLVTAAVGLSGVTQLYKSHVGYPDSLTCTFLLASVLLHRHTAWCWGLQALSVFAHEQAFFFWPFLLMVRRHRAGVPLRRDLPAMLAIAAVYAAFRVWLAQRAPEGITPGFYFGNGYFPLGFLGVLYLAMMQAVLSFGPTLPLLGWLWARPREEWERRALLLLAAGIVGIYMIAHDFNRFVNFLFLPLLGAEVRFLRQCGARPVLAGMLVVQVLVTLYVATPVSRAVAEHVMACGAIGAPANLRLLMTCVLPRVWPTVLLFVVILVALLGAGAVWARRTGSEAERSD